MVLLLIVKPGSGRQDAQRPSTLPWSLDALGSGLRLTGRAGTAGFTV